MSGNAETTLEALGGLLRPLARTLLARGVTAPAFERAMRAVMLEEAEAALLAAGEPATASRVALMTGLHRKEVAALRAGKAPGGRDAVAAAVALWRGDRRFQGRDGAPRGLDYSGGSPTFETLGREALRGDAHPRTLLDEMRRRGLVGGNEWGEVVLREPEAEGPDPLGPLADRLGAALDAGPEEGAREPEGRTREAETPPLSAESLARVEREAESLVETTIRRIEDVARTAERNPMERADRGEKRRLRFSAWIGRG